ncbi:hypothetical protein PAXRUDRAFT_506424 [Paxillus rubicundulus Ve08.2h10]|uniref:Unplaced genomic scaffold scaffold_35, whole genome shotgun sequence n=1 Tax=Paxillus rubicundulus Ve08.2h10 TaxID=930991 RepID=A0A0D0E9L8_9AGAM|nr:hypothetical protein PAXRUDRAFT_506424 [Paxillus rubicundulus Ve08.2h10]
MTRRRLSRGHLSASWIRHRSRRTSHSSTQDRTSTAYSADFGPHTLQPWASFFDHFRPHTEYNIYRDMPGSYCGPHNAITCISLLATPKLSVRSKSRGAKQKSAPCRKTLIATNSSYLCEIYLDYRLTNLGVSTTSRLIHDDNPRWQ